MANLLNGFLRCQTKRDGLLGRDVHFFWKRSLLFG